MANQPGRGRSSALDGWRGSEFDIKPGEDGSSALTEGLARFDETEVGRAVAEHEARLSADQALIYELQWQGFEGDGWQVLSGALVAYGLTVIRSWILSDEIILQCRRKGLRGVLVPDHLRDRLRHHVDDLTQETVACALDVFKREALILGGWTSSRGATLRTFFIGQALIQFTRILRIWVREEARLVASLDEVPESQFGEAADPAEVYLQAERSRTLLGILPDPVTREIIQLVADEYTYAEIGQVVGLSTGAVALRLHRARKRYELWIRESVSNA